jgi:PilZ domain
MKREREQRATFRVAVRRRSGLTASLRLAGQTWSASIGDISPEGMFITLDRSELPALAIGGRVYVDVTFHDEKFRLHGVVRSQHAGGYGLFFPERDAQGRVNPRERLGRISVDLQRGDLSQRLKVLKLPE